MSFWQTSEGQKVEQNDNFEMGGGDIEPMPNNTKAISMPTEAKWDEYEGQRYISIRWDIVDGEYKNRVVFQKLRVLDSDPKKADKAKRMLAAIDSNAGGNLFKSDGEPTDMQLASALCNKPMAVVYRVWEMEMEDGTKRSGNWVAAVESSKSKPQQQQTQAPAPSSDFDDDVGF